MLQTFQKAYDPQVSRATIGLSQFYSPGGEIQEITIWGLHSLQTVIFNVRVNGVALFSGGSRPTLAVGDDYVQVTGLTEATLFGDVITLDVEQSPQGGVSNIAWQVIIEDGVPVGGATDLDGLSDVDTVSVAPTTGDILQFDGSLWVPAALPASGGSGTFNPDLPYVSPSAEDDEFDAGTLDAKWATVGTAPTSAFDVDNHLKLTSGHASQLSAIMQPVPNTSDQEWRAKFVFSPGASFNVGLVTKELSANFFISFIIAPGGPTLYREAWLNTTSVFNQGNLGAITVMSVIYLSMRYVSSTKTWYFAYSTNGIVWKEVGNYASLGGAHPDKIGIISTNTAVFAQVDWFRKLQGVFTGGNE